MAPTVKDVENSTSTSTSTLPSSQVANPVQVPARPQPIPLEVPVSVNGARTMEGSDKREPFSESTKTVLVFANGAVIRLASSVAPGQLLFVTNDKTKKEVVCQVVKSKNYRTVTGYVELEFTESAPGFWGVRIPTDPAPAAPAQPKAPIAQRPATPPAAMSPAIGTPKVATPPAPVALQTSAPVAPPKSAIAPTPVISVVAPKPEAVTPPVQHVAPAPPPAKTDSLPTQLPAQLSALTVNKPVIAPSQPAAPETPKPSAPQKSGDASTEELRQQAARLQEQLSSLLFRESAPEKAAAPSQPPGPPPVLAPTPVALPKEEMLRGADALQKAVAELEASAKLEAKPEAKIEPIKISLIPATVAEIKSLPVVSKKPSISLPVEEVKIPSWLAPLARESEATNESSSSPQSSSTAIEETFSHGASEGISADLSAEPSQKAQTVVFGGQLLGGADSTEVQASSSGSKKGLIFGLVAATVLGAVGVAWYGMQPGNFLASRFAPTPAVQNNRVLPSEPVSKPEAAVNIPASTPNSSASVPSAVTANNKTTANPPAAAPAVETSRNSNPAPVPTTSNSANTTARNVPAAEAPKKPVLGDVRLATPNVNRNRTANSASSEAAPSIDAGEAPAAVDPLAGIAANHRKEPAAPLPVGGDVKPARLLKSVPPMYPPAAKSQRISGNVQLDALIDATGAVTSTKVISGPTLLHQAAVSAVKQWKYEPAQLDGKPTSMHLVVTVQFRLQ